MNKEKLVELKSAMKAEQMISEEIAEERKKFEEEHAPLFVHQAKIREQIIGCKMILTENAEAGFAKDKIKKRLGGIGIRVGIDISYEEEDALKWAQTCMPVAVKTVLDKTLFNKFAKDNTLDFVKKGEKITVTFPKEIKLDNDFKNSVEGKWIDNSEGKKENVISSNLRSVSYDDEKKVLQIEFNNGGMYQYLDVPKEIHTKLMEAESKGSFVHKFIKGKFEFKKIV